MGNKEILNTSKMMYLVLGSEINQKELPFLR
jgi:hypothetical protein